MQPGGHSHRDPRCVPGQVPWEGCCTNTASFGQVIPLYTSPWFLRVSKRRPRGFLCLCPDHKGRALHPESDSKTHIQVTFQLRLLSLTWLA